MNRLATFIGVLVLGALALGYIAGVFKFAFLMGDRIGHAFGALVVVFGTVVVPLAAGVAALRR